MLLNFVLSAKSTKYTKLNRVRKFLRLQYELFHFYIGLRNKNERTSYRVARAAFSRHVVVELNKPELNLFREAVFCRTNHVLDGHLNKEAWRRLANDWTHTVSDEDFERLKVYFDDVLDSPDAAKLSFFCWYDLKLHCAFRSSEIQVALKKEDIVFANEAEGGTNATIWRDFTSKYCRGGIDGREFETSGRIQEAWQLTALYFNHLTINVQGVPRPKKQESRLKLKRKKVKWTLFSIRFWAVSFQKKRMLLLPAVVLLCVKSILKEGFKGQ